LNGVTQPPLPVLHEAGGVVAVAKPAGLPTQAPPGIDSAESLVRRWLFGPAGAAGGRHPGGFLGVPHRLDRSVSGVLLFAATPRAARQLSRQFERRLVEKTYLAWVELSPTLGREGEAPPPAPGDEISWCDLVRKRPDEPRAEVVTAAEPLAREAVTLGLVRGVHDGVAVLELYPRTGRMHQLRVQAAARGMPVLGDTLYGACRPWGDPAAGDGRDRPIALHAWKIRFLDPVGAHPVEVIAPPPPDPRRAAAGT